MNHLAPQDMVRFVLADGSASSNQSVESEVRKATIKADLVNCLVALPGHLLCSTQVD